MYFELEKSNQKNIYIVLWKNIAKCWFFVRPFNKPAHFVSYLQCPVVFRNTALMCPIIDSDL